VCGHVCECWWVGGWLCLCVCLCVCLIPFLSQTKIERKYSLVHFCTTILRRKDKAVEHKTRPKTDA